ncbi:MAG: dihydrodipicolinate synthase family protein [Candidatus Binataceae bacterium]
MDPDSSYPRGIFAAVLTPLTPTLEPDPSLFVAHCRWLIDHGCDGLVPLGTTGEGNSLSVRQRLLLIQVCAQARIPAARFIVGTGSCALADAVEVTRAAVAADAAGVLVLPPFYYKEPSEDGLFAFYSELIARVGDARLRLYLYHYPQLSTVPITPALIGRLTAEYPSTIAGLKDSSGDWSYSARLIKEFPRLGIFSGNEEHLLTNLRAGGAGCISANVNVSGLLAQAVYRAWREGQGAEAAQKELDDVRIVLQDYPIPAALKHLMSAITGNPGWNTLLPPNRALSAEQTRKLMAQLSALPGMKSILAGR